jgi:hypothetical protein
MPLTDLFKLQDQVVARLSNTLGLELVKAEAKRSARSRNPDVVDLDMRGWVMMQQWLGTTKDYISAARAWFEQALKIDPNDPDALAGAAYSHFQDFPLGWPNPEIDYEAKVLGQADRAIALAHDNLWVYYVKANYLTIPTGTAAICAERPTGIDGYCSLMGGLSSGNKSTMSKRILASVRAVSGTAADPAFVGFSRRWRNSRA